MQISSQTGWIPRRASPEEPIALPVTQYRDLDFHFVFLFEWGIAAILGLASGAIMLPLVTITYSSIFFPEWLR